MTTTRTKVSKANPAIKAIISKLFPEWTGRKVTVLEVDAAWDHTNYCDDSTVAYMVYDDATCARLPRAVYGSLESVVYRPFATATLVMLSRFMGQDMGVEIVVLRKAEGHDALRMVAGDTLESGDKRRAHQLLADTLGAAAAGPMMAALEAEKKAAAKGAASAEAA